MMMKVDKVTLVMPEDDIEREVCKEMLHAHPWYSHHRIDPTYVIADGVESTYTLMRLLEEVDKRKGEQ